MNKSFKYIFISLGLIVIPVLIVLLAFVFLFPKYQKTNDAYVETNFVEITSNVSGTVSQLNINNNSKVKKRQIIAQINPEIYIKKLDKLNENLEKSKDELKLSKEELKSTQKILKENETSFETAKSDYETATNDANRYKNGFKDGIVTKKDLEKANKNLSVAKTNLKVANENLKVSQNSIKQITSKIETLEKDIENLNSEIEKAKQSLDNTTILSDVDGIVVDLNMEENKPIKEKATLALVVPNDCYLVAYFNNRQVKNMEIGQTVKIKINTYNYKKFIGKIVSIDKAEKESDKVKVEMLFTNDLLDINAMPKMDVKVRVKAK